jgi:hypothetical protein
LRQNSKYHVSVSAHGYDKPEKLEVSIKGQEKSSEGHQKLLTLSGNSTEILEFDVSLNYSEIQKFSSSLTLVYVTVQEPSSGQLFLGSQSDRWRKVRKKSQFTPELEKVLGVYTN